MDERATGNIPDSQSQGDEIARLRDALSTISEIQLTYARDRTAEGLYQSLLDLLLKFADSPLGFIARAFSEEEGQDADQLRLTAISNMEWEGEEYPLFKEQAILPIFVHGINLLGPLLEGRSVNWTIHDALPEGSELPKGHPIITSFLAIPVMADEKVVGAIGMANREGGYSDSFYAAVEPIANTIGAFLRETEGLIREKEFVEDLQTQIHMIEAYHSLSNYRAFRVEVIDGKVGPKSDYVIYGRNQANRDVLCVTDFTRFLPEDRDLVMKAVDWTLKSCEPIDFKARYFDENGRRAIASFRIACTLDERTGKKHLFGHYKDASAKVRSENELQQSMKRLNFVLDSSDFGVFEYNLETSQAFANPRLQSILGVGQGDLDFDGLKDLKGLMRYLSEKGRDQANKILYESIYRNKPFEAEFEWNRPIGESEHETCWLRIKGHPLQNEWGEFDRFSGLIEDISARKKAEEEIKQSERHFRGLIEQAGFPILIFDPKSMGFLYANPVAREYLAIGEEAEISGHTVCDFLVEKERMRSIVADISAQGFVQNVELPVKNAQGKSGWILLTAALNLFEGDTAVSMAFQDITSAKESEQLLKDVNKQVTLQADRMADMALAMKESYDEIERSRREADEANEAKSEFLATMSHEIRTPMNTIIGMAELLARMQLDEKADEYTNMILDSGTSLLEVVDDILDYSKLEAGRLSIVPTDFEPVQQLRLIEQLMLPKAEEKDVDFECSSDAGVPELLLQDSGRVRQVLLNLVANALKFTEKGSVKVNLSSRTSEDGATILEYQVVDTGIGIAPESIPRLFKRFSQADESISGRFGGTGLGLAICKQIIDLMNGEIWCESELGKGSVFAFTIPSEQVTPYNTHTEGRVGVQRDEKHRA